jgi:RimJ/RimL family protein N-acetyltransferase
MAANDVKQTTAAATVATVSPPIHPAVNDVIAESSRLRIRGFRPQTEPIAPMVLSILNDPEVVAVFPPSWHSITTAERAESWYADRLKDSGPTYVIERRSDGAPIGFFGILPVDTEWLKDAESKAKAASTSTVSPAPIATKGTDSKNTFLAISPIASDTRVTPATSLEYTRVELGYMFARSEWGKGYATEAVRAALKYLFSVRSVCVCMRSFTVLSEWFHGCFVVVDLSYSDRCTGTNRIRLDGSKTYGIDQSIGESGSTAQCAIFASDENSPHINA